MSLQLVKLIDPIQLYIAGTFTPKGAYAAGTDYAVGDMVDYLGSSYIMYVDAAAGTVPTDTTKWGIVGSKGDTGTAGSDGSNGTNGTDGTAATATAGSTTTGAAGSSASVANSGSTSAAVFDFTIPRGDTGAAGADGVTQDITGKLDLHAKADTAGAADTAVTLAAGTDRTKLDGIAAGATANSADATLLARANHTGTQTAATISDFSAAADARVALVIDAAPGTLDTLNELAAALGDDANYAATITSALALKAPLISPVFTTPNIGTATGSASLNVLKAGDTMSGTLAAPGLLLQDAGVTKGYRFRTSGASLDFDFAGTGFYLSGYPNANFTGTQQFYLGADTGGNLDAFGVWRFHTTPFAATSVTIDSGATYPITTTGLAVTGNLRSQTIIPSATATYDLGSTGARFVNAWITKIPTIVAAGLLTTTDTVGTLGVNTIPFDGTKFLDGFGNWTQVLLLSGGAMTGLLLPMQHATTGAPAYVKGGIYFDTTLNKLRVGGATAWETITST